MLACALVTLAVTPALAQPERSAEDRQAILGYRLTMPLADKLLAALPEMSRYVMAKPNAMQTLAKSMKQSFKEWTAQVEADPGAMVILRRHGLAAREYVVGVPALRVAIARAGSGNAPGLDTLIVSPENLAFAKAHLAELKPKLDAADQMPRR